MRRIIILLLGVFLILGALKIDLAGFGSLIEQDHRAEDYSAPIIDSETQDQQMVENFNTLNGFFTANNGQADSDEVRFYIPNQGIWFLDDKVVFLILDDDQDPEAILDDRDFIDGRLAPARDTSTSRDGVVLHLSFQNANTVTPVGREILPHQSNFFYGNEPSGWYSEVPNFEVVLYENIYDNIDLKFYFNNNGLKYEFIVHPGGDPSEIRLKYDGADGLAFNEFGDLVVLTEFGEVKDCNLFIYQEQQKVKKTIEGAYRIHNRNEYGFELSHEYDPDEVLIIDPFLIFATFIGTSTDEWGWDFAIDPDGFSYANIETDSINFPTSAGAYDSTHNGIGFLDNDIVIFKLNQNGSALVYATYIGGNSDEYAEGIDIDSDRYVYATGYTNSNNFPTTAGAYDTTFNGGFYDAFVFKLNQTGSVLSYSTYIGGGGLTSSSGSDYGMGLEVDTNGRVFLTGVTRSSNFPTTAGAYDTTHSGAGNDDAFVLKLNPSGTSLLYSTLIGGTSTDRGYDIAIDAAGNAYVTGPTYSSDFPTNAGAYDTTHNGQFDAFVAKFNAAGSSLTYSTYIGGSLYEYGYGITIDSSGHAYLTGLTRSADFPTTAGVYDTTHNGNSDAYVAKLNPSGSTLIYSTYIGGSSEDRGYDIKIDALGNAYMTGHIESSDFPTTPGTYDSVLDGWCDGCLVKFDSMGTALYYSSYYGGLSGDWGAEIELDANGDIFIFGIACSTDFPTTPGAYQTSKPGGDDVSVLKVRIPEINLPPTISAFTASSATEGTAVVLTVNVYDPDGDTLTYSYDFDYDGIYDLTTQNNIVSYVWGDDHNGTAKVQVSDANHTVEATTWVIVNNAAPTITPFGPVYVDEGNFFNILGHATDPGSDDLTFDWKLENILSKTVIFYNDGVGADPYPSPDGVYPFAADNSLIYIFGDDGVYNLSLKVQDDDGLNVTYTTTIIVGNVAPQVELQVYANAVNVSFRIAGEKWHDIRIRIYKGATTLVDTTLVRYPGSPNDQMFTLTDFTIDVTEEYWIVINYTPEDDPVNGQLQGANPCWVIFEFEDGNSSRLHHTFNVNHPETYDWEVNMTQAILLHGLVFVATAYEPGADDLTFIWQFNDGSNITHNFPNPTGTFPVTITDQVSYGYLVNGTFGVTLTVQDDDGGFVSITKLVNVSRISRFWHS